jgi:MFS family permease
VTWLVLDITIRSDSLGLAMALQFLPMLVLGAPAGVLANRIDNRRLLVATSLASGCLAFAFGSLVGAGHVTVWSIYGLTLTLGLI